MTSILWHIEADPLKDGSWTLPLHENLRSVRWDWPDPQNEAGNALSLRVYDPDHSLGPNFPTTPVRARFAWPWTAPGPHNADIKDLPWPSGGAQWLDQTQNGRTFTWDGPAIQSPPDPAGSTALYTVQAPHPYPNFAFRFTPGTTPDGSGVALALHNAFNYLRLRFTATATQVHRFLFGIAIPVASGDPLTPGEAHWIEVENADGRLRVYATSLDSTTFDRITLIDAAQQIAFATAARVGIFATGTANTDRWADFGFWRPCFQGTARAYRRDGDTAALDCIDDLTAAQTRPLYAAVTGSLLRGADIANQILNVAGWSANHRRLDLGETVAASGAVPLWGITLRQALKYLASDHGGPIYIDERGYIRLATGFFNPATPRSDIGSPSSTLQTSALTDLPAPAPIPSVDLRYPQKTGPASGMFWSLANPIFVPLGESVTFLADAADRYAVTAISTVEDTDFTANTREDDSGADLAANFTITIAPTAAIGRGTFVTVANTGPDGFLTTLNLSSPSIYDLSGTVHVFQGPGAPLATVDSLFIDNIPAAQRSAAAFLAANAARDRIALDLPLLTPENTAAAVHYSLFDAITINTADRNAPYLITAQQLNWAVTDERVEATAHWTLERPLP